MHKKYLYHFGSGPSCLPKEVKEKIAQSIHHYEPAGVSILEMYHRTEEFDEIVNTSKTMIKNLMSLGEDYEVLFLQGGATQQFSQIPINFLAEGEEADYINTGVWSTKAIKAAKKYGNIHVIASSEKETFSYIPKTFSISNKAKYLHLTSNNTIYGTQWHHFPQTDIPIVVDMSSDILSRDIDYSQFSCIYAGAQKNLGVAGCTIVILEKQALQKVNRVIPDILDYDVLIENNSMLNTPPVLAIYACYEMLRWSVEMGGIEAIAKRNREKAKRLYDFLDASKFYMPTAEKSSRSDMNICFTLAKPELEKKLYALADDAGITGIAGHRSIGGFRIALYNAITLDDVDFLITFLDKFQKTI